MITYEQLQTWLKEKENKQKIVLGVCFILVFLVGYGSGSYVKQTAKATYKPQANYTTQTANKPEVLGANITPTPAGQGTASSTATCIIKGNISSTGKKIYHVQGGEYYARVKPEQCFDTEAEAQAAGFVKSSR